MSVLPTALLSTHTGSFGTPERLSTKDFLENTLKHFLAEDITFDGFYTGYFAEINQIGCFSSNLDRLKKEKAFLLVDPVLGDKGRLFSGITEDFVGAMLSLCKRADVITPNVTEACLLCGEKYCEALEENAIIDLCLRLYDITHAKIIITGIEFGDKIGVSIFDGEKIKFVYTKKLKQSFHGTGDIFASLVFANVLKGNSLEGSVKKAVKFISKAISKTDAPEREGLEFESLIKEG